MEHKQNLHTHSTFCDGAIFKRPLRMQRPFSLFEVAKEVAQ